MHIWFAAHVGESSHGGIARSMRELAQTMRGRGHSAQVYFGSRGEHGDNYFLFALKMAMRLVVNIGNPPDWIVARSSDGVFCAMAAQCLRLKTKVVLHNHGWEEIVIEVEKRLSRVEVFHPTTWKAAILRLPLLRASLRLCAFCLSGTITETRWIGKRYPQYRGKLLYVPNGVSIHPATDAWVRPVSPPEFFAIGGWTWKKNLDHTIAVFKQISLDLPEAKLFMVGDQSGQETAGKEAEGRIETIGLVAPDRMAQWYERRPYLVVSSRYEGGHSLAILEAMSFGCVVFASQIASTMEIITDGVNGVFISGCDVVHDAKRILQVIGQPDVVEKIGKRARALALRNRWQRQAWRLERALCP